jgi:hypothetical protein
MIHEIATLDAKPGQSAAFASAFHVAHGNHRFHDGLFLFQHVDFVMRNGRAYLSPRR